MQLPTRRLFTKAALTLGLMFGAAQAQDLDPIEIAPTFDAKMYPGSACQPYHGTQAFHFLTFQNGIAPRLLRQNSDPHPKALWVTCPIVRDNTSNTDGTWKFDEGAGLDVFVDVPEDADPKLLSCHLFSYDLLSGHLLDDDKNDSPVSFAPGRFALSLSVNRSSRVGNYVFLCHLPWRSTLRAYRVREYVSTDDNS